MPRTFAFILVLIFLAQPVTAQEGPSLDEMIGQMIMVGFRGMTVEESDHIREDITERRIGGVILFDYDVPSRRPVRNIQSPEQVRSLISGLNGLSDTPLFIAVDQEGGRVNRLKERFGFPATVSHQYLGRTNHPDTTRTHASSTATLLRGLGFNVNFAPVVDVNINPENPVIGKLERSFSGDASLVAKHAGVFIEEHRSNGVIATVKHFPGHGSAWNDSHYGLADVSETWKPVELQPYRQLISQGLVDMVMSAHIFHSDWHDELPATLNPEIMTGLLRQELGFEGVLVSDDMQMGAITEFFGLEQAVVLAVNAGIDLLIFANNSVYEPEIASKVIEIIRENVASGRIQESRIRESYARIMELKNRMKGS